MPKLTGGCVDVASSFFLSLNKLGLSKGSKFQVFVEEFLFVLGCSPIPRVATKLCPNPTSPNLWKAFFFCHQKISSSTKFLRIGSFKSSGMWI